MRTRLLLSAAASALVVAGCAHDPLSPALADLDGPRAHDVVTPCDFITFGRLEVTDGNGNTVVISGNAGGNAPGGGIMGELQVSWGGVSYHVHTVDEYGIPLLSDAYGPFVGDPYARVIVGSTANGTEVHLRLHDDPTPGGGEPGEREGDQVFLQIGGSTVIGGGSSGTWYGSALDRGNVQLHTHCRGPKR